MTSPFPILIDLDDALPVYAQIERQMRHLITSGYWEPGDQVPSVREMAVRLRVNPLTVHKSYRRLKDEKLLVSRPGAGVYVAPQAGTSSDRMRAARDAIEEAVDTARSLGLENESIEEMVARALKRKRVKSKSR